MKQGENKTVYKGTFEVPNLSEEYQPKEVDVTFTLKDNNKNEKLKDFARKEGLKRVREQLEKYLILLKEGNKLTNLSLINLKRMLSFYFRIFTRFNFTNK